jgi:general secretion pathway protein A
MSHDAEPGFEPAKEQTPQGPASQGAQHVIPNPDALLEMISSEQEQELAAAPPAAGACARRPDDFISFFSLKDHPFQDALNAEYFYKTASHEQAYVRMMMSVRHSISLSLVTGHSGTGKSMLSQMMLQQFSNDPTLMPVVVLVSPGMSKTAFLRELLMEMELDLGRKRLSAHDMIRTISNALIQLYQQGRKLVLMIDECHFLKPEALHTLRTLSNIELPEKKLVTCLLFGEPAFLERLDRPDYDALRSRIFTRTALRPLNKEECEQYVKYRLLVGGAERAVFDPMALDALHFCSGGNCRQVNKLCTLAMMEAFSRGQHEIDAQTVGLCAGQL